MGGKAPRERSRRTVAKPKVPSDEDCGDREDEDEEEDDMSLC